MIAPFRSRRRTPGWMRYLLCAVPLAAMLPAVANAAVTIAAAHTSNVTCTKGVCTPTQADAVLNYQWLENELAKQKLTINTGSGALASQVQNIVIAAPLTWASANSLTLNAYQSITVTSPVSLAGSGGLTLITNDGGSGGALSFAPKGSISFLSTANALTINGASYTLANSLAALASDMNANTNGHYALSASYNAGPDGTYTGTPVSSFAGTVEGLGNAITNLTMNGTSVGLVTSNTGLIENLRLVDIVETKSTQNSPEVGVLVSVNTGQLIGDSVTGTLTAKGFVLYVGGLVGVNEGGANNGGVVSRCSSDIVLHVAANTQTPRVGGLVGSNADSADLEYSYSAGLIDISGTGTVFAGGLVGGEGFGATNSYSTARITVAQAVNGAAGGLIGDLEPTETNNPVIEASLSYSTGSVSGAGLNYIGGSIGRVEDTAQYYYLYWDTTTSGTNQNVGTCGVNSCADIVGLTTSQLQAGVPPYFEPTIWAVNPKINGGLPYLIANPPN
jgi:hypothetical protein